MFYFDTDFLLVNDLGYAFFYSHIKSATITYESCVINFCYSVNYLL